MDVNNFFIKLVNNELENNFFPILVMGGYINELKELMRVKGISSLIVHNVDDLNEFVADCYSKRIESPIFIEDISTLSLDTQQVLLKFLEDLKLPIVLLSVVDKVIPTIISRVKFIFKKKLMPVKSSLLSFEDFDNYLDDNKKGSFEIFNEMPLLYYYEKKFRMSYKSKIFGKLSKFILYKKDIENG